MSKKSFDRLDRKQQGVLIAAGKKSQAYFAKEAKGPDDEMVKVFKANKVEVVTLTPAEYDQWVKVARESSYPEFAKIGRGTRLNSSHSQISYAVFCLKKKKNIKNATSCPNANANRHIPNSSSDHDGTTTSQSAT